MYINTTALPKTAPGCRWFFRCEKEQRERLVRRRGGLCGKALRKYGVGMLLGKTTTAAAMQAGRRWSLNAEGLARKPNDRIKECAADEAAVSRLIQPREHYITSSMMNTMPAIPAKTPAMPPTRVLYLKVRGASMLNMDHADPPAGVVDVRDDHGAGTDHDGAGHGGDAQGSQHGQAQTSSGHARRWYGSPRRTPSRHR